MLRRAQSRYHQSVSAEQLFCLFYCRKVVSLSCSPSGSKFVYATSCTPNTGGSRLSAMSLVPSWRPQDVKFNSGTLAVLDMKSNAKEVDEALVDKYILMVHMQAMLLMEAGSPAVNCTTFNHNGNLLLAGGSDGIVRLFGKCQHYMDLM